MKIITSHNCESEPEVLSDMWGLDPKRGDQLAKKCTQIAKREVNKIEKKKEKKIICPLGLASVVLSEIEVENIQELSFVSFLIGKITGQTEMNIDQELMKELEELKKLKKDLKELKKLKKDLEEIITKPQDTSFERAD